MNKQDLLLKIAKLIQRSRQAVRVYSSIIKESSQHKLYEYKNSGAVSSDIISDIQANEWKEVNIELLRKLTPLYSSRAGHNSRSANTFVTTTLAGSYPKHANAQSETSLREFEHVKQIFLADLRLAQTALHKEHKLLTQSVDAGDYVSALRHSTLLVSIKTRCQALDAVCKELGAVSLGAAAVAAGAATDAGREISQSQKRLPAKEKSIARETVNSHSIAEEQFIELSLENADLVQLLKERTLSDNSRLQSERVEDKNSDQKPKASRQGGAKVISTADFRNRKIVPLLKGYKYK